MRIHVRHETSYRYARPAGSAIQVLRLTPRNHQGQFVKRWRVEVDADHRLDRNEDAFGNITHTFTVDGPIEAMRVSVEGEVDTHDTGGVVAGTAERLPDRFYLRGSALTRPDGPIREFARGLGGSDEPLARMHALLLALNESMTFNIGATTAQTTASEAFASRTGVCQDLTHVFVTAARSLGVPARFVSGHLLRPDTEEQEAGHAWAEALVPTLGWVGFDPTNGVCVTDSYVRIACGLDALDAAPVRGARVGGSEEQLTVSVRVAAGRVLNEQ